MKLNEFKLLPLLRPARVIAVYPTFVLSLLVVTGLMFGVKGVPGSVMSADNLPASSFFAHSFLLPLDWSLIAVI